MKPTSPSAGQSRLLSVCEIADNLGLSQKTIRRFIAGGDLVAYRVGRSVRVSEADLETFRRVARGATRLGS